MKEIKSVYFTFSVMIIIDSIQIVERVLVVDLQCINFQSFFNKRDLLGKVQL